VEVEGQGLRVASLALPEVESLFGTASGTITVAGTLDDPRFAGQVSLTDGDLKTWSLREHFSPARFVVSLKDSIATLQDVRLRVRGEPNDIVAGGRLIFHGLTEVEYDLTARGTDIPLSYEYADCTGRFDLDVTVRGLVIPLVGGRLLVREAYYRDPLEATDSLALVAEQVEPDTTSWNVNLDVEIPNNAWVKNDDVNAELSGDLRVIRTRGQWNYLGSLEPVRGSYYLFGRKFRNLRGSIVFDDVHEVDPELDLEADVNLPISDSSGGAQGGVLAYHEVTVRLQGRLSEPEIIPPASLGESNFIRALYPLDDAKSAAQGASGFLTGEIERAGTRLLGVETLEIRPSETGRYDWGDARLRIGTYLLPDVYVYGGSSIDPSEGTEYGFEYRLKNWLRLQGHRSYDNLYQFDLNLKWEADK
jgi:autotransporter translocation and assembly factor TamB